jgi:hypothetical protein
MQLAFTSDGLPGTIHVTVKQTGNPDDIGAWPGAHGLANCEATVTYPGRGYRGQFGWIQMVRSTDNTSGGAAFEMDPLEVLGSVPHPFCYYGISPTLFDAPARDDRGDLDWLAHAFLCRIANRQTKEIRALAGFRWGFIITAQQVSINEPAELDRGSWNQHVSMMRSVYSNWRFNTDH